MDKEFLKDKLPGGWIKVRLIDIAYINMGQSPPSNTYNTNRIGLPFFQGKTEFGELFPSINKYCSDPVKVVEDGDILISVRAPIGPTNLATEKSCIGRGLAAIRPYGSIPNKFILYYIRTNVEEIVKLGTGSTFKAISKQNLENFSVLLPPINEQFRIVQKIEEVFSELDHSIKNLNHCKIELIRYRHALLKSAVEGKLTLPWRKKNQDIDSAKNLLIKIKNHILSIRNQQSPSKELPNSQVKEYSTDDQNKLPKGWIWTNLGNITTVVRGASPRPAGDPKFFGGKVPWITVAELTKDDNMYLTNVSSYLTDAGKKESRFISKNTLLLSNSGATLGVPKITSIDGCINDGSVAFLNVLNDTLKVYLYWVLKSKTKQLREINQGAGQPNLNTEIVKNINIPLPPIEEQLQILQELEYKFGLANNLNDTIDKALKRIIGFRHAILQKIFKGNLVKQNSSDPHAEGLIELINQEKIEFTAKQKIISKMKPKKTKSKNEELSIVEILASKKTVSAKDVWIKSKHKNNIEEFYSELKSLKNSVLEIKTETESMLKLK